MVLSFCKTYTNNLPAVGVEATLLKKDFTSSMNRSLMKLKSTTELKIIG
jgi:hypothetical protein